MIAELPPEAWQALSAGEGSKGDRLYDWARVPLDYTAGEGFSRWLLARRSLRDPEAVAYYFAYARTETTLPDLAAAAGLRWTIEECLPHGPRTIWASITARRGRGTDGIGT